MEQKDVILKCEGLTKKFAGVLALDNVSLDIRQGEVHALCGENGAGKSTLIKIISGAQAPTSGKMIFEGQECKIFSPLHAYEMGISTVYQELSLVPYLTVSENIFLGKEITRGFVRDKATMNRKTKELCNELGIEIDVNKRVCDLGLAYQQLVEIVKAVSKRAKLIILDEPTAVLTINETKIFFKLIERLKKNGVTILFISHRIEEVFELCDRVTVLCDGRKIITKETNSLSRRELIAYMVGREIRDDYPRPDCVQDEILLEVRKLHNQKLHDISFYVKKGEIVGFGGLVGAGRTELARAIFGADKIEKGEIIYKGENFVPKSPRNALVNGIGLIPENRKEQGIIPILSVAYNQTIIVLDKCQNGIVVSKKKEARFADQYIKELKIKVHGREQQVRTLSGGNQQKVVLSKILARECELIIFDEPTRGIDVNAKQEIYAIMEQLASEGKAIIMISSDMPELMGMSNRIYIMSNGFCVKELSCEEFNQEHILELSSSKL